MQKILPIVIVILLILVGWLGYSYWSASRMAEDQTEATARMMALEEQQQALSDEARQLRSDKERMEREARQAEEALEMSRRQAEREEAERAERLAALNERLQQEAAEREAAEQAQQRLTRQIEELMAAQEQTRIALAELEQARAASEDQPDPEELMSDLRERESRLIALQQENERLRQQQELLEQRQIETEDEIFRSGGRVTIENYQIRSPNFRRGRAILFQERILGRETGGTFTPEPIPQE